MHACIHTYRRTHIHYVHAYFKYARIVYFCCCVHNLTALFKLDTKELNALSNNIAFCNREICLNFTCDLGENISTACQRLPVVVLNFPSE
jgi:hypothetical protein